MTDFPLLLDAPGHQWAERVQTLVQRALGQGVSVTLGLPGERFSDAVATPRYVVTGVVVCDEPEDEMLVAIRSALVDYEVEEQPASATTRLVVRPRER